MVERDVNHPSILFWDNGNEGGWNRELDREFAFYDPQNRRVLHPWELHDDVDTKHYPTYPDLAKRLAGAHLVMPTEVLHGLYDGGHGAGLEDYWKAIARSPVGAGAFLWSYADEGIARTDQNGRIDVVSSYAPDGIVGPKLEKEGSFFTIRDLWSPVQIERPVLGSGFDGTLEVTNLYDFTALNSVKFNWRLLRFAAPDDRGTAPRVLRSGSAPSPEIPPHAIGRLKLPLPSDWDQADALAMTATAADGSELWSWTWPTPALASRTAARFGKASGRQPIVSNSGSELALSAGGIEARFDGQTGMLRQVRRSGAVQHFSNGPRLAYARPRVDGATRWLDLAAADSASSVRRLVQPQVADSVQIDLSPAPQDSWAAFKLELSPDGRAWRTVFDGSRRLPDDGNRYSFPPQTVAAIRISAPHSDRGAPIPFKDVRIGFDAARYPAAANAPARVTSGTGRDTRTGGAIAWVETEGNDFQRTRWTVHGDGMLQLDYTYALEGDFLYHGVTFDHAPSALRSLRTLSEGPFRSWQNRLRGTTLAVHERVATTKEDRRLPEFEGYFAGLRWANLQTDKGRWTVAATNPDTALRVGTPLIDHPNTTVEFPAGDISFLHAIPAIGSKFVTPANSGPASQPAKAAGTYSGTLYFRW
jgi:hypothetical protein